MADLHKEEEKKHDEEANPESDDVDIKPSLLRQKVYKFIESTPVIIFMMTITVWVLFSDDIRQVAVQASQDEPFYYVVIICFCFFAVEIILTFYCNPEYRWGFFFWLDIISTLSLLLDTQWVSDLIFDSSDSNSASQKSAASLAKTARASRIGTRASRVVRIVRLIRLIRVVKLYKATKQAEIKSENKKKPIKTKSSQPKRKPPIPIPGVPQQNPRGTYLGTSISQSGQKKRSFVDSKDRDHKPSVTPSLAPAQRSTYKHPSNVSGSLNGSFISKKPQSQLNISQAESQEERSKVMADAYIPELVEEITGDQVYEETNVGKQLSDLTTKRVIILILSIMISIPIFSIDTYWADYSSFNSATQNLIFLIGRNKNITSNTLFLHGWKAYIESHTVGDFPNTLLNVSLLRKDSTFSDNSDDQTSKVMLLANTSLGSDYKHSDDFIMNQMRQYEKKTIIEPSDLDSMKEGEYAIVAVFDISSDFNLNSYLNIGRTVFVCIILSASAIFFSKDATELVLDPIENMLKKVKRISENPLRAAMLEEEETVFWTDFNKNSKKRPKKQNVDKENYETTILEKTIVKIGALLALGFGEAGAEIVAKNMQGKGEIDPMLPGKKVVAIFGFCDIRNFTDATEVLQEGVDPAYKGDGFRERDRGSCPWNRRLLFWCSKQKHRGCFPASMEVRRRMRHP